MLPRSLAPPLLSWLLLVAACGGGERQAVVQPAATARPAATSPATPSPSAATPTATATPGPRFGIISPMTMLSALQGTVERTTAPDPSLLAGLIGPGDLPGGFMPAPELGLKMETEVGTADSAVRIFFSSPSSGPGFGTYIMTVAMRLPPGARERLSPEQWPTSIGEAELAEIRATAEAMGMPLEELRVLDVSGLRGKGFGLSMAMDLSRAFPALGGSVGGQAAMAMDIYGLSYGDHLVMLMVMWLHGTRPDVEASALVRTADARASAAFR